MVVYSGSLYIFGGLHGDRALNDLWLCRETTHSWLWTEIHTEDGLAPKLYDHAAVVWDRSMWLFGGANGEPNGASNVLFQYEFEGHKWAAFPSSLDARTKHTAVAVDNILLLLGGCGLLGPNDFVRDIVVCDLRTKVWHALQADLPEDESNSSDLETNELQVCGWDKLAQRRRRVNIS